MRGLTLPSFVKYSGIPYVEAHSRGATGESGQPSFGVGGGARWKWVLKVVSLSHASTNSWQMRATLHSLRGPAGTIAINLPGNAITETLFGYSDATDYSDSTDYSDQDSSVNTITEPLRIGVLASAAASGATSVTLSGFAPVAGEYMTISTSSGQQLVQIVAVASQVATIRPRLRYSAPALSPAVMGAVAAEFRLSGQAPVVPMIVGRSMPFDVELEEAM